MGNKPQYVAKFTYDAATNIHRDEIATTKAIIDCLGAKQQIVIDSLAHFDIQIGGKKYLAEIQPAVTRYDFNNADNKRYEAHWKQLHKDLCARTLRVLGTNHADDGHNHWWTHDQIGVPEGKNYAVYIDVDFNFSSMPPCIATRKHRLLKSRMSC